MAAALIRISRRAQSLIFSNKYAHHNVHNSVHTSVWWDAHSVQVDEDYDCSSIAGSVTDALAKLNYAGPVTFSAYGDFFLDTEQMNALSSTGVKLTSVFYSYNEPHLSSISMLRDILFWSKEHPAPANYLLITGREDLSFAAHQLAMKGYNILLASTEGLGKMEALAKAIWRWESLLAGCPPESTA